MPSYRMPNGVVVDIPAETAARIDGLTPVDGAPPSPAKKAPAKKAAAAKSAEKG
jgi:hypothetical protein